LKTPRQQTAVACFERVGDHDIAVGWRYMAGNISTSLENALGYGNGHQVSSRDIQSRKS
jgi:hypothetical protein